MSTLDRASSIPGSVFRHPPFALFWGARVLSSGAYHMQAVALGWQVYAMTDSALALGFIGLAQFAPMLLLTLLVGHVADRYDRRLVIRICQIAEAVAAALLALGSAGGWLTTGAVFAIVFVTGVARAFELPSLHALVPGLVPGPLFPRATAASASANQSAIIAGPALGGLLYALGPSVVFACCAAIFLLAAIFTALIRLEARSAAEGETVALARLASRIDALTVLYRTLSAENAGPQIDLGQYTNCPLAWLRQCIFITLHHTLRSTHPQDQLLSPASNRPSSQDPYSPALLLR